MSNSGLDQTLTKTFLRQGLIQARCRTRGFQDLIRQTVILAKRDDHPKMIPRQFESGTMSRQGRISKQGPSLLRRLLVQIAWGMEQRSAYVAQLFARISGGQKTRRKKAAVAVARKILVWCWAMLRDGTRWRDPAPMTA